MNINRFIRWVINNFFIPLLAVYSLLYACWFILLPVDDPIWDLGTFAFGLDLLIFSTIISILWRVFGHHNKIRSVFAATACVSLLLTGLYLCAYMPELEEAASFNGNVYFLTYHHQFLNHEYNPLVTKWDRKLHHTINSLGGTCCTLRLTSDPISHQVNVVEISETTQTLSYTDSDPPRTYEPDTQIGDYRYYPSEDCATNQDHICHKYSYTVYRCSLENTGCEQLPFQYLGDYAFKIEMFQDEQNKEINIYFWIGDYPGVRTLIFTYGNNSRCQITGCQLLAQAGKISP